MANIWLFQKTRNPSFSLFMTISCLYVRKLEIEGTLSPCYFVPLLQFIFMIIKWVSLSIFMWTQSNSIFEKFRNSFLEENLAKAASAALMRSLFKITIFIFWEQLTEKLHSCWFTLLFTYLLWRFEFPSDSPITCSKLTIETLEQGGKYVQS